MDHDDTESPARDTWHATACVLCSINCGLEVRIDGPTITRVRGDKAHPGSQGYTCEKGLRIDHYQNGPHRLTSPLRRRPDGIVRGDRLGHRHRRGRCQVQRRDRRTRRRQDPVLWRRRAGQPSRWRLWRSTRAALGITYTSNALAQEKTGEFWVDGQLFGRSRCHTTGDYEHAQVAVFWGKNPWQSHGFPQARKILKEIANDPARTLIVVDPRRTEIGRSGRHPPAAPPGWRRPSAGRDAGHPRRGRPARRRWLADNANGLDELRRPPAHDRHRRIVRDGRRRRGHVRQAARASERATGGVSIYEDLGIQMAPHSTLNSYLEKLVVLLTGNFGMPGGMNLHSHFAALLGGAAIAPAMPSRHACDRPSPRHRTRAVQRDPRRDPHRSSRPLPGDARRVAAIRCTRLPTASGCARRCDALDLVVVIDVALTETARQADYVLPAASQFEKWECTFFNLEFPHNVLPPAPADLRAARRHAAGARDPRAPVPGARCATTTTTSPRCTRRPPIGRAEFTAAFFASCSPSAAARQARRRDALRDARARRCDADGADGRRGRRVGARADGARRLLPTSVRRAGFEGRRVRARRRAVRRAPRQPARPDVHGRRLRRDDAPPGDVRRAGLTWRCPRCSPSSTRLPAERVRSTGGDYPVRACRRRASLVDRQHDPPRSRVAQERPAGCAAGVAGRRRQDRSDRRRPGADDDQARHGGRRRRSHRHACCRATSRCPTASASAPGGTESMPSVSRPTS